MSSSVHGLPFAPPEGWAVTEVMVQLKGPPVDELKDPRMMQSQYPLRPNLIVHRRQIPTGADLDMVAAEICAELVHSIEGMRDLSTNELAFADGHAGRVVQFDFPAGKAATVRQFQALRLDDDVLTTLTLTVDATTLNDERKDSYFQSLASAGSAS